MAANLDEIIEKLYAVKDKKLGTSAELSEKQLLFLISESKSLFFSEPNILTVRPPLTIVGDIHGQFPDLCRIFEKASPPPTTRYLFLGDYVDRGFQSIECLALLMAYKLKFPTDFYMIRGNHECSYICRIYGFYDECRKYYSSEVWDKFIDFFNHMPLAAIVEDKIFCVHGGLSPSLINLDQIKNISRPHEVPEEGLFCDILWSDPSPEVDEWEQNERGTSFCYGARPVQAFLAENNFDLLCRAHQAIMDGFEFPFYDSQCVVTVFSAPNYCYEYENKGAILHVSDTLSCAFTLIEPLAYDRELVSTLQLERPGTPPRKDFV